MLLNMDSREKFFSLVSKKFKNFKRDGNIWTYETDRERPGAQMIINGQRVQSESVKEHIKVVCDFSSEYQMGDETGIQVLIDTYLNERHDEFPGECISFDDLEYLEYYLNSIM